MRVSYSSLGCPKNLVDTERVLGALKAVGSTILEKPPGDIHIINTCAFIEPAVKESVEEILKAEKLKEDGFLKGFFVMGCLTERYGIKRLRELFPSADGIFGVPRNIPHIVSSILGRKAPATWKRHVTTLPYAYLKIGDGCSRRCSFCIIPKLRGRLRSAKIKDLLYEAEDLVSLGAKEIILVAQDTTQFGRDTGESLHELLKRLDTLASRTWIRVMYMHPGGINERILEAIGTARSIVRYFDIPIQHSSDKLLSAMRRGYRRRHIERLYRTLRDTFPDSILRTTVMVGFPGEGKKEFEELISFIKDHPFEYLGGFTYFDEDEAHSRRMKPKVTKRTKERRLEKLYRAQEVLSEKLLERFVGKELEILTEGGGTGRFYGQAPEVDGIVFLKDGKAGEFKTVKIRAVKGYDLAA